MSGNSSALQSTAKTQSTSTFVTALWLNAAIFGAELIVFTLLRQRFKAIYEPRTYVPADPSKRSPPLSEKLFAWPLAVLGSDYRAIKHQNGMDAYFFVRFLRMMIRIFFPIWFISWAVLLPVTSIESGSNKTGLDRFTFGNIGPSKQGRYWAHVSCVWVFTIWIWYVIWTEMRHFITTRQQHLVDAEHSATAQANTILITGIPTKFLTERALKQLFSHLPGGVRKVWLNRDLKELPDIYERRLSACNKLESAETALIALATKIHAKKLAAEDKTKTEEPARGSTSAEPLTTSESEADAETDTDREKGLPVSRAEALVPRKKRPTHRLPIGFIPFAIPLIGKKVDSIDWARQEIEETTMLLERGRAVLRREIDERAARNARVGGLAGVYSKVNRRRRDSDVSITEEDAKEKKQAKKEREKEKKEKKEREEVMEMKARELEEETYPALSSAFVLFNQQIAAHIAYQALTHHEPYHMSSKDIEVAPADVIWGNLGLIPYERKFRTLISYGVTLALIVLWSFPVAFIGAVSNISNLCKTYSWLAWLCKVPPTAIGVIQGVLPAALLTLLMMLLPIVLRLLARFEGIPRKTGLELSLMTRYFCFQVVHSFLIVTLSSGIIAALPGLVENPTSIPGLLASSLPQASTFFLTYTILQGLSGTAAGFLQIAPLLLYYVKLFILGSTPRSLYKIKYTLRDINWGTLFPATTLIAVISIAYSVISPIINGLAVLTFFLFYQMWKYLFLYQLGQPAEGDTGGLFFPKAIQHVFVGLYIQQICLCALFFLARNTAKTASAVPEAILMVVLIFFTVFFHMLINNAYGPLLYSLPLSLADKSYGMPRKSYGSEIVIGDERPEGFGGDTGQCAVAENSSKPARQSDSEASDSESDASHVVRRRVAGKQPIRGEDAPAYGPGDSVPMEGKRNDEPTDFYHPAGAEPLRAIWIPRDALGLADAEVEENERVGISASCVHAVMDAKGHVDIDGHPPGMQAAD
ncbi:DUF221-domain-containing protein [Phellopilus nigrolimitatus]|nr:DUF221-domain-containing protein [Phellopilus nigrolimitatus]